MSLSLLPGFIFVLFSLAQTCVSVLVSISAPLYLCLVQCQESQLLWDPSWQCLLPTWPGCLLRHLLQCPLTGPHGALRQHLQSQLWPSSRGTAVIPRRQGRETQTRGPCACLRLGRSNGPGPSLCSGLWPRSLPLVPTPNTTGFIFHPTTEGWWLCDPELLARSEFQFPLLQSGANRDCFGRCQRMKCQRTGWARGTVPSTVVLNRVPLLLL